MSDDQNRDNVDSVQLNATDYVADDGSVVHSGVILGDAVLDVLNKEKKKVRVSLLGLKGASSSYFNVFLRRINEGCGVDEIGETIELEFDSNVQRLMFERSHDSMRRGPRQPVQDVHSEEPSASSTNSRTSLMSRIFGRSR